MTPYFVDADNPASSRIVQDFHHNRVCFNVGARLLEDCQNNSHELFPYCKIFEELLEDCCRIVYKIVFAIQKWCKIDAGLLQDFYNS